VLETDNPMHQMAANFVAVVDKEARALLAQTPRDGVLTWDRFSDAWFAIVRQVVFGSGARDDRELHEILDTLRSHGNWAFLSPGRPQLREELLSKIRQHISRAEPGSLVAVIAKVRKSDRTAPEHQVPQWLFAFDPAGMTTFRALALLAVHRDHLERAKEEIASHDKAHEPLPLLRATVLETLRLWPTTPLLLRETTRDVEWETGLLTAGTGVVIFAPFFHRDDERLAYADRFAPEIWEQEWGPDDWPMVPFSLGPGVCPGRHIVQLVSSAMLAAIVSRRNVRMLQPGRLSPSRRMPAILNQYSVRPALY
jgi:cytochrome P450